MALLQGEIAKAKPSQKQLRKLMRSTFDGRRQWILNDRPVLAEILDVFPHMKEIRYVNHLLIICDSD